MLIAIATSTALCVSEKNSENGTITMAVSSNAALRMCIRQKMQPITVIDM
jgi:hypothetical protein